MAKVARWFKFADDAAPAVSKLDDLPEGQFPKPAVAVDGGFGSFASLKRALGPAGENREWHHIVEKSKVGQFGAEAIHHTGNVVSLPRGLHGKISAFYSRKIPEISGNQTIREWLQGKSFDFQYQFGLDVMERFSK